MATSLPRPKVAVSMAEAADDYDYLQSTRAIRERSAEIFDAAQHGKLEHFRLHEERLPAVVERVIAVTRAAYPDLRAIPYHGRYRHFDVGHVARLADFQASLQGLSEDDKLRSRTELVITSVLLDAGAGPSWRYRERDGRSYGRSEGLAVASYHLFRSGALSRDGTPMADADGLASFTAEKLACAFQVTADNPLTGVEGRAGLLRSLGEVVRQTPIYFDGPRPRLGNLGVFLKRSAEDDKLPAVAVLDAILRSLGAIWPGRERAQDKPLGDVWRHSRFGLVPFHKLSQWLSYSLLEPLEAAHLRVEGLDQLTGLPEYRNGGLFLDAGVLELADARARERDHEVGSDLVIEWRALTVALLDRLADGVRRRLGLSVAELPLARVLEGGSWRAGRVIAAELRDGGGPPLDIRSDGTVF
jgi:Protein of unknown function (DUF1688)